MLLEDGRSRAVFFELVPLGTEGRDPNWMQNAGPVSQKALQNSFDEHETSPWIVSSTTPRTRSAGTISRSS